MTIDLFGTPQIKNYVVNCIPYMGTKRKLATKILNAIYSTIGNFDRFYDVFGGGGALSVAALYAGHESHYNELNTSICELLKYIIAGNKLPNQFVSREEYKANIKGDDWYAGFLSSVWSFGNNQRGYLYGTDIERTKMLAQNMVINQDETARIELEQMLNIKIPKNISRIDWRRLMVKEGFNKQLKRLESLEILQRLERLQRLQSLEILQRLESLESLERSESLESLEISNLSYDEVIIKNNSVIYCDPPYKNTGTYQEGKSFDYDKFYEWCLSNPNPVFISGYEMPKEFELVRSFKGHRCTLSATNNSKIVTENLYWNGKHF